MSVLLNGFDRRSGQAALYGDQETSDEAWSVIEPLFRRWKGVRHPILDMRTVVETIGWRFRTGSPWRDVPERFGNWNSIYGYFSDWRKGRHLGAGAGRGAS